MMQRALQNASPIRRYIEIGGNIAYVLFVLVEITFNYYMCVTTRNNGPSYDKVVRELAESTNFDYPKTPQDVARFRRDFNDKMMLRMRRRQAREAEQQRCCDGHGNCNINNNAVAVTSSGTKATVDIQVKSTLNNNDANNNEITSSSVVASPPAVAVNNHGGEKVTLRKTSRQQHQQGNNKPKATTGGGAATYQQIRSWMLMAPDEWGFCARTVGCHES